MLYFLLEQISAVAQKERIQRAIDNNDPKKLVLKDICLLLQCMLENSSYKRMQSNFFLQQTNRSLLRGLLQCTNEKSLLDFIATQREHPVILKVLPEANTPITFDDLRQAVFTAFQWQERWNAKL